MHTFNTGAVLPETISVIPGDKSISHRAIIIGALAKGSTTFHGFLMSQDCLHTLDIFKQLGVQIEQEGTTVTIYGKGPEGLQKPENALYVGNSGTGIRLITGVLAGLPFNSQVSGDASIQQRPMDRVVNPLTTMGAQFESDNGTPPIFVTGNPNLLPGLTYTMPVASAQVKSAMLLAGVTAGVPVTVIEPEPCRDHTERMLQLFGAQVASEDGVISLNSWDLTAPSNTVQIPADISSALFFICLALMTQQSVTFTNIGLNPSRIGCLTVLKSMGANIEVVPYTDTYEPMGDIVVHVANAPLTNITLSKELVPNVIDELPILAVLATACQGTFTVQDAKELRVKESDRIDGICRLITALGGTIQELDDGFLLEGGCTPTDFNYDSHFDHRLAMSATIAAYAYGVSGTVEGEDSIATSFPNFFDLLSH
jgi:3-phosphoshikimate 1-carboxyvinyltransferase